MPSIEGGCHCGNIRFHFETGQPPEDLPVRRCTCTFCAKHGAFYTSDPAGRLVVSIRDPQAVNAYRFGTRTAEPQVCRQCGVVPVILARIDEHVYAVVNLATAEGFAILPERIQNVNFEHQTAAERNARRVRSWIAQVSFAEMTETRRQ
jgi:hypothetical protein